MCLFKKCLSVFERQRERERESMRGSGTGAEREGNRGSQAGYGLIAESWMQGFNP